MGGRWGRRELVLAGAFAVLLLATAGLGPAVVDARPAFEIPVYEAAGDANYTNATSDAWGRVPAASVALSPTGAAVPASDNVTAEQVNVEAARSDGRLYLRLSWADPTRDASTDTVRAFADSVAVQIPASATNRPPIAMGGTDNRVNVWYWSATGATQELLAGGPGTTSRFEDSAVTTDAAYRDGRWRVTFARSLDAAGQNRTAIPSDADMDVAVAVWNGSNMERSGRKAASGWYYLALGPGPDGPPYQTILWVIAGLAIVVSALVTIEGVRRTRGE